MTRDRISSKQCASFAHCLLASTVGTTDAAFSTGRRIKCLTVVDDFTKELVGILMELGTSGLRVTRALDEIVRSMG